VRVAVVHDWLVTWGGAERVLEQILVTYPQADVFCLVEGLDDERRGVLDGREVHETFIARLPRGHSGYWYYAALMPLAIEQFDLAGYDLIVSSSHAVALGVISAPGQVHVSYLHSPMRFAWDLQPLYLESFGMSGARALAARLVFHYLRMWDRGAANGVDRLLTCSAFAGRRAQKVYRRETHVVHPPVDVERFALSRSPRSYFLAGSRMNPFKRIDLIVQAFRSFPGERLIVIGDGPDLAKVRRLAGPNVEFAGHLSDSGVVEAMGGARAFIHAATEDFGIAMAEAQATGTPVIALGEGGAVEILSSGETAPPTGVLFGEQSVAGVCAGMREFLAREGEFSPEACRAQVLDLAPERFRAQLQDEVRAAIVDVAPPAGG
jgi:glycosyltransferase involved in cell wall biosynthesis